MPGLESGFRADRRRGGLVPVIRVDRRRAWESHGARYPAAEESEEDGDVLGGALRRALPLPRGCRRGGGSYKDGSRNWSELESRCSSEDGGVGTRCLARAFPLPPLLGAGEALQVVPLRDPVDGGCGDGVGVRFLARAFPLPPLLGAGDALRVVLFPVLSCGDRVGVLLRLDPPPRARRRVCRVGVLADGPGWAPAMIPTWRRNASRRFHSRLVRPSRELRLVYRWRTVTLMASTVRCNHVVADDMRSMANSCSCLSRRLPGTSNGAVAQSGSHSWWIHHISVGTDIPTARTMRASRYVVSMVVGTSGPGMRPSKSACAADSFRTVSCAATSSGEADM